MANEQNTQISVLSDLPLSRLISEPLIGAAKAQQMLSQNSIDYINQLSQDKEKVEINVDVDQGNGQVTTQTVSMSKLLASDLSTLGITKVTNEFTFEISTIQTQSSSSQGELKGSASAGAFISKFVDISVNGSLNQQKSSKTTNSQRGTLNVQVEAERIPAPVGVQLIIDAALKGAFIRNQGAPAPAVPPAPAADDSE